MTKASKVVGGILAALSAWVGSGGTAQADPGAGPGDPSTGIVLVLIDRSGSMADSGMNCIDENGAPITTPIRKWECAVKNANFRVKQGDSAATKRYFLWAFGTIVGDPTNTQFVWALNSSGNPVSSGGNVLPAAVSDSLALSRASALTALTNLAAPTQGPIVDDAATPLAGAYCSAISALSAYRGSFTDFPLTVVLESDGLENATPSGVQCQGVDSFGAGFPYVQGDPSVVELGLNPPTPNPPTSPTAHIATADGLLVPSWQSNMLDMAVKGVLHAPDATGQVLYSTGAFRVPPGMQNFTTNITFINQFIQSALMLQLQAQAQRAPVDIPAAAPVARFAFNAAAASGDPGLDFFSGLANVTGGRLITIGDGSTPPPGDPTAPHAVPGDINDSGCVDQADFNLLQQSFNQPVSPANPATFAADINTDARVDINDYLMLVADWGLGCAVSPGPPPVLGQSIFGFDNLAQWSAQVPLSLVGLPRTEGLFSMSVGGSGWRPVRSINFNTSVFQGAASRISLDVALPAHPSNRFWLGQILVFANCPSANVNNVPFGNVELTGKPLGSFSNISLPIPQSVRNAMLSSHADFSFTVVLNANDPGYLFDNLRLLP